MAMVIKGSPESHAYKCMGCSVGSDVISRSPAHDSVDVETNQIIIVLEQIKKKSEKQMKV